MLPDRSRRLAAALLLLLAVAACSDEPSGPRTVPVTELRVVEQGPAAPALAATIDTLIARRGEDAELRLYYRPLPGVADSSEFLRLRLDDNTLLAHPNGTRIAVGESVRIIVTVLDPRLFGVHLEPEGLRFNPDEPAELRWRLVDADDDLDDDGDVDQEDGALLPNLAVWRQARAGEEWARLASRFSAASEYIEADLTSFSNYVVAYRSTRPSTTEP